MTNHRFESPTAEKDIRVIIGDTDIHPAASETASDERLPEESLKTVNDFGITDC
ncbi:hypothetical protein DFR71_4652 [Nocardia alba]|uniref:Uncharacterized protein n=1 Tax=Nocardia alba TaxID=225051 RepID=A0A4V2PB18_9NOCA|nr:hypothetical protein DFR71_4652 [Nocardia alba]